MPCQWTTAEYFFFLRSPVKCALANLGRLRRHHSRLVTIVVGDLDRLSRMSASWKFTGIGTYACLRQAYHCTYNVHRAGVGDLDKGITEHRTACFADHCVLGGGGIVTIKRSKSVRCVNTCNGLEYMCPF